MVDVHVACIDRHL